MFRIESYIALIILRIVQKYVKNLKVQDTQLSLWSGEGVFYNLDLRTSTLEEQFGLPFRFVNGHIHELRIAVPWHKITYEPIVVTINTMECVLSLPEHCQTVEKDRESETTESNSDSEALSVGMKRSVSKQGEEISPGYIQSLVRKITNNITIVCNNLILKYVEDDIVLSVNVPTVKYCSANEDWEPEFTDFTPPLLFNRKLINFLDLTICLDHRSSSGRIDVYQEPILYRCSFDVRWLTQYSGLYAAQPDVSWISVLCDKLKFSVSDSQLPMVRRLMELVLAFVRGDLSCVEDQTGAGSESNEPTIFDNDCDEAAEASWGEWAWSLVPSTDAFFAAIDDDSYKEGKLDEHERVFVFSAHVSSMDVDFKYTTANSAQSASHSPLKFSSFMHGSLQGSFFNITRCGIQTTTLRTGVSKITLYPSRYCTCEKPDMLSLSDSFSHYLSIGNDTRCYLSDSLFGSNEVTDLRNSFSSSWDFHLETYSKDHMLSISPAFAFDYIYNMDLPIDFNAEQVIDWDALKTEDIMERTLLRMVIGKATLNINCGFIHRIDFVVSAISMKKYSPYKVYEEPSELMTRKESSLGKYINSLCSLNIVCVEPLISMIGGLNGHSFQGKNENVMKIYSKDINFIKEFPMYPLEAVSYVNNVRSHSKDISKCYVHHRFTVPSVSVHVSSNGTEVRLALLDSISYQQRSLCLPGLWKHLDRPITDHSVRIDNFSLKVNAADLANIMNFICLRYPLSISNNWYDFSLEFCLSNLQFKQIIGTFSQVFSLDISDVDAWIHTGIRDESLRVLHPNVDSHSSIIRCLVRIPTTGSIGESSCAPVFLVRSVPLTVCFHPVFIVWWSMVSYAIKFFGLSRVSALERTKSESSLSESHRSTASISAKMSPQQKAAMDGPPQAHGSKTSKSKRSSFGRTVSSQPLPVRDTRTSSMLIQLIRCQNFIIRVQLGAITVHLPNFDNFLKEKQNPLYSCDVSLSLPNVSISGAKDANGWDTELWRNHEILLSKHLLSNFPLCVKLENMTVDWISCVDRHSVQLLKLNTECTFNLNASKNMVALVYHANTPCLEVRVGELQVTSLKHLLENMIKLAARYPLQKEYLQSNVTGKVLSITAAQKMNSTQKSFESAGTVSNCDQTGVSGGFTSLWIQWTIPRISLALLMDSHSAVTTLEDNTIALDWQTIFCKIKLSVGSGDMIIQRDKSNCESRDMLSNVVFTSAPRVKRDLKVKNPHQNRCTPANSDEDLIIVGDTLVQPSLVETKCWFSATWTKALRSDVLKKWGQIFTDTSGSDSLSELELKVAACDFVLTSNFISSLCPLVLSMLEMTKYCNSNDSRVSAPISSNILPIIYADIETVRLFFPVDNFAMTSHDDFILFQASDLSIRMSSEIPISRPVLLPDIYEKAQVDGSLQVPGSGTEDRQYQVDISDVFVASAKWEELLAVSVDMRPSVQRGIVTMGENPAVDWNNFDPNRAAKMRVLLPIFDCASIRMVWAPAIISGDEANTLVAGYGFELSFISDVIFLMGIYQLDLLSHLQHGLAESTVGFIDWMAATSTSQKHDVDGGSPHCFENVSFSRNPDGSNVVGKFSVDSGLESECTSKVINQDGSKAGDNSDVRLTVPCESILHFNSISCYLYDDSKKTSSDSIENVSPSKQISPIYHAWISQPQFHMKSCLDSCIYQVSVFDVSIRTFQSHRSTKCCELIPDLGCYGCPLLEMKASSLDDSLGVVLNFVLEQCQCKGTNMTLDFCGPIELRWDNFQERTAFNTIDSLKKIASHKSGLDCEYTSKPHQGCAVMLRECSELVSTSRFFISQFSAIIDTDFIPGVTLYLDANSVSLKSTIDHNREFNFNQYLDLEVNMDILNVSSSYVQSREPMVPVISLSGISSSVGFVWGYMCDVPRTNAKLSMEFCSFDVRIGQLFIVKSILEKYNSSDEVPATLEFVPDPENVMKCEVSKDDLRSGMMKYVIGDQSAEYVPNQILFDKVSRNMTWRYPEERCLRQILVLPIPLVNDPNIVMSPSSSPSNVRCNLQYFDRLFGKFVVISEFELSEEQKTNVEIPVAMETRKAHFSDIWRIQIHITSDIFDCESSETLCPTILASCIHVNSEKDARHISQLRAALSIGRVELRLHDDKSTSMLPNRKDMSCYSIASSQLNDVIMSTVIIDGFNVGLCKWCDIGRVNVDGLLSLVVINPTFLVDVPIIEKSGFKLDVVHDERIRPPLLDVTAVTGEVRVNLSPLTIISLVSTLQDYHCHFNSATTVLHKPFARYVLVNNTGLPLIIGQCGTNQSILLHSMCMSHYSWYSCSADRSINIGVPANTKAGKTTKICDSVSLDSDSVLYRTIETMDETFGLIISIVSSSSIQKVVTIEGRLQVWNLTDLDLSVHLDTNPFSQMFTLKSRCKSPSVVCKDAVLSVAYDNPDLSSLVYVEVDLNDREAHLLKLSPVLHVWCSILCVTALPRQVAVFSPVFCMKSLLSCSLNIVDDGRHITYENRGNGSYSTIYLDPSSSHSLTLKMDMNTEPSSPPLPLSSSMLDECDKVEQIVDIESTWLQINQSAESWLPDELDEFKQYLVAGDQNGIRLHVAYERRWPWLNTLTVKIYSSTMLVNLTDSVLSFRRSCSPSEDLYISPFTVSPSSYEDGVFFIGVFLDSVEYQSKPMQIGRHGWLYERSLPSFQGVIPSEGFANFHVFANQLYGCFCVRTCRKRDIQWIMIHPATVVFNNTQHNVAMTPIVCSWSPGSRKLPSAEGVNLPPMLNRIMGQSLIWWHLADGIPPEPTSVEKEKSHLLDFSGCRDSPMVVKGNSGTFSVNGPSECCPLTVSYLEKNGQCFVMVNDDSSPHMIVENDTDVSFYVNFSVPHSDMYEFINGRGVDLVSARSRRFFPSPILEPDYKKSVSNSKIFLSTTNEVSTRSFVDLTYGHQQYLRIEDYHFSALVVMAGPTYLVKIQKTVGVVVSVTKVRQRLLNEIDGVSSLSSGNEACKDILTTKVESQSVDSAANENDVGQQIQLTVFMRGITVVLCDDTSCIDNMQEVLCFTSDFIALTLVPGSGKDPTTGPSSNFPIFKADVCIGNLQVDNQILADSCNHNFDVLVSFEKRFTSRLSPLNCSSPMELSTLLNSLRRNSVVTLNCSVDTDTDHAWRLRSLILSILPFELYLDDKGLNSIQSYLLSLIKSLNECLIKSGEATPMAEPFSYPLLSETLIELRSLDKSVHINHLRIEPIKLNLNVETQLKLCVSVVGSPVNLPSFERFSLCTSSQKLLSDVLQFYLWSALYKTGTVFSSLDLLGNPGGFARSMTRGVKDLFEMPYHGLTHGPLGFFTGCMSGVLSFGGHLSSGTLDSMVSFSSGVARNLDALALDADHAERSALGRRVAGRTGVVDGVTHGLTGLGMSLLSAVAGLADQPLQGAINSGTASSIIGGVGRGLAGVVVKPLGGAVDLITHTGRGIMFAAGWKGKLNRRRTDSTHLMSEFPLSLQWFAEHFNQLGKALSVREAILLDAKQRQDVFILISVSHVCVIGTQPEADLVHQHEIRNVDLVACINDPNLLTLCGSSEDERLLTSPPGSESADGDTRSAALDRCNNYVRQCLRQSRALQTTSISPLVRKRTGQDLENVLWSVVVSSPARSALLSQFQMAKSSISTHHSQRRS